MKKHDKTLMPELRISKRRSDLPQIMRIIFSSSFTRIDFGYGASAIYIRGGWINISPHTILQVQGMSKKYRLTDTIDIPYAPGHFEFESRHDWKVFSLIFEPLPMKSCLIRMVEEEPGNRNSFNYEDIEVDFGAAIEIILPDHNPVIIK
jgi:hypothetical protein